MLYISNCKSPVPTYHLNWPVVLQLEQLITGSLLFCIYGETEVKSIWTWMSTTKWQSRLEDRAAWRALSILKLKCQVSEISPLQIPSAVYQSSFVWVINQSTKWNSLSSPQKNDFDNYDWMTWEWLDDVQWASLYFGCTERQYSYSYAQCRFPTYVCTVCQWWFPTSQTKLEWIIVRINSFFQDLS